jgi:hypothetical protein
MIARYYIRIKCTVSRKLVFYQQKFFNIFRNKKKAAKHN